MAKSVAWLSSVVTEELLATIRADLRIRGQWRKSADGRDFPVEDPATGALLIRVADGTAEDAIDALDAASEAQTLFAACAARERSEILRRGFELLRREKERMASIIALEAGKPIAEARREVDYAAEFLRWFSEEAVRIYGRYQNAPSGTSRHLISRRPIGPCLLVTPWNFPLAMVARKVGPAIAAGCTMILKPSELTPLTAICFAGLMEDAGLSPGILNVLTTNRAEETIGALLADCRLRKISFTGSTRVGRLLLANSAANMLRTSLELGGNAPFIIFEDADLDAAVEGAVLAKLRNVGQACTAANRFLVHEAVAADFIDRLTERFASTPLARDDREGDSIGSLISATARSNVHALVCEAVDRGAQVITGGTIPDGPGYFYPPTILSGVASGSRVLTEEIFGPVAPVQTFVDEGEAIQHANATPYGLAAYAYTTDLNRALRLQEQIDSGMLGINTGLISDPAAPFGGIKHSGLGREGGVEGIEEYLTTHYAAVGQSPSRSGHGRPHSVVRAA
jgi:succinate-semialdehyde dehydrogenase / glutarate-semialdehyde dehydrogenase